MSEGLDINPIAIIWDSIYGMAETFTGIVGLTPPQLGLGFIAFIVILLGSQLVMSMSGKRGWTLDHPSPENTE